MKKLYASLFIFSFSAFFFSWFFLNNLKINSLPIQSEDVIPAMYLPYAIIQEKTLYLDTYYSQMIKSYPHPDDKQFNKGLVPFYLKKITKTPNIASGLDKSFVRYYVDTETHYASAFPIIAGILALPFYFIPVILGVAPTLHNLALLMHVSSAALMSFAGVLFFHLVKVYFAQSVKNSVYLWGVYSFATVNFAMLSQALWQHGVLHIFFVLGLISFYQFKRNKKLSYIFLMGMFLGFSLITRPTALIPACFLTVLLLVYLFRDSRVLISLLSYLLGYFLPTGFFFWYTQVFYRSITNQGYFTQASSGWLGRFPESFLGIWFSPSKGILTYSPVLLFAILGFVLAIKFLRERSTKIDFQLDHIVFGCIVLVYTLVMSKWKHWYGGYSFGYRMSSDILPFLVLLLIPYFSSEYFEKTKKLFFLLFGFSVSIQLAGLAFFDGIWHAAYDKGFVDTSWLWSLKDSEMAFNFRRVLVKFGWLKQACEKCLPLTRN